MPATEQTWRQMKTMHIVFAISALIMGVATIWMMAADHMREWKGVQLQDRRKDAWMLASRRDQLAETYRRQMAEYDADIRRFDSEAVDQEIINDFKQRVADEDARIQRAASGADDDATAVEPAPINKAQFAKLDQRQEQVDALAGDAAAAREATTAEGADESATAAVAPAEDAAIKARKALLAEMDVYVREARRRETALVSQKKNVNGIRTAAVSELGIKIGEGADEKTLRAVQGRIDNLDEDLGALTEQIAAAKDYRMDLEELVARVDADKAEKVKNVAVMRAKLAQLDEQVYKNTSNVGEWITRWPVLNALYSGNIRVEQNWLPDMTINYNFAQAARFDRCTTCHRAISTTAPDTATDPLYPTIPKEEQDLTFQMATPEQAPAEELPSDDEARAQLVLDAFGLAVSETGILRDADVTVHYVLPDSLASRAGLQAGDKLASLGGQPPRDPRAAITYLLTMPTWGKPMQVDVHRGLEHPFTAHPRLDLFLSDLSPHPQKDVGCTICHDGQGSGTSFVWTSHTPDNATQQEEWADDHGWMDNHHWIFPMKPARFVESNCLKCHHQKGALEPSERFPEPPAPKLVEGWTLVEEYGCFGCHEINGFDSPTVTVGPDVRLEPNYNEVAAQIRRDPKLSDEELSYISRLLEQPTDVEARELLYTSIKHDEELASDPEADAESRLTPATHRLATGLKPVEMPGQMRKVGPSLRHLNSKVEYEWLFDWIRQPKNFRPSTKMPQFFLQYEHLTEADDARELQESLRFEPIEMRALAEYLLAKSDEFEYIAREEGVAEPSADRGKWLFESRGCLACHSHEEFPGIAQNQGPDLSRIGAKLNSDKGKDWLYSWLKQPSQYHARTKMPDLFLDPIQAKDAQGQPTGDVTDPAADLVEFLLSDTETDWNPVDAPARGQWTDQEKQDLLDLAVLWLKSDTIPASRAKRYLEEGIDPAQAPKLKTDELLLVNWPDNPYNVETRTQRQLEYVARRTIGKYGCFGCHDIPGFEEAKPIGTALVDWGRKESSKLAFENIHKFLESHGINPEAATEEQLEHAREAKPKEQEEASTSGEGVQEGHEGALHAEHLAPGDFGPADSYFIQSLNSHARDGFLWQKLRHPRSYDYKTTHNKNFNERLRMPRFPFSDAQREAVMTFVLGLVKEPPASKYIYRPSPRQQAIVDGRAVLERFNCAGCHTLKMEQWEFAFAPGTFEEPAKDVDYPFLAPRFTDQEMAASEAKDYGGFMHATVHGEPMYDVENGGQPLVDSDRVPITLEELREAEAEEGETIPVYYQFTLWKDALVGGETYLRGLNDLLIPADRENGGPENGHAYPAWGGDLARYLFPKVIAKAKEDGSQAKPSEAWGWLPPPLMDEGMKVQTDWLHSFLMDPTYIRPAVVLRMPNFHMSSDEAAKLVNYFAASSNAQFPYEYRREQRSSYLAQVSQQLENPLDQAMNIVVNGTYCVKCHQVGDFQPAGDPYTFGPNLADVYKRMRPTYLRNWIAYPTRVLPYTGMPKNIPYNPTDATQDGVSEQLFPGDSMDQLMGLVDLLMNFDVYAKAHTSVSPLVQESAAAAAAAGAAPAGEAPGRDAADGAADEEGSSDEQPEENEESSQ
jgi:cytochrome c2